MATLKELRTTGKELGIRGYSTKKKTDLIEAIENHHKTKDLLEKSKTEATDTFVEPAKEQESVAEPKAKKSRSPNAWHSFLNDYRKEHGGSLKQAMAAKDEYAKYKANWKSE